MKTWKSLGTTLKLPNQYEHMRDTIENHLPPLRSSPFHHVFKAPQPKDDDGQTLVTLHGTGGSEHDLIRIARDVAPSARRSRPPGQAMENGMPRFFGAIPPLTFSTKEISLQLGQSGSAALLSFRQPGGARSEIRNDSRPCAIPGIGANIPAAIILLLTGGVRQSRSAPTDAAPSGSSPRFRFLQGPTDPQFFTGEHDEYIPSRSRRSACMMTLQDAGASVSARSTPARTRNIRSRIRKK